VIHPRPGQELPAPLSDLQTAHPDWSIWQSAVSRGWTPRCYATRLTQLTDDQVARGLAMTVHATTPEALAVRLDKQTEIASRLSRRYA
jgi:hypothetical protein